MSSVSLFLFQDHIQENLSLSMNMIPMDSASKINNNKKQKKRQKKIKLNKTEIADYQTIIPKARERVRERESGSTC